MKLCKDCKYLGHSYFGSLTFCMRPAGIDVISGDVQPIDKYCSNERSDNWLAARFYGSCGKEARYFKEKA